MMPSFFVMDGRFPVVFTLLALVGLAGALAGGCPVRQIVMTGEGNGDAFVAVLGITVGGALAHNLGLVSAAMSDAGPGGPTRPPHREARVHSGAPPP